jgi:hypothetical protein
MKTLPIVEHFDILKNNRLGLLPGLKLLTVYTLAFKCAKEALDQSIVPTISFAAHA